MAKSLGKKGRLRPKKNKHFLHHLSAFLTALYIRNKRKVVVF